MAQVSYSPFVMAGLDPAIHPEQKLFRRSMDARVKPGHDDLISVFTP